MKIYGHIGPGPSLSPAHTIMISIMKIRMCNQARQKVNGVHGESVETGSVQLCYDSQANRILQPPQQRHIFCAINWCLTGYPVALRGEPDGFGLELSNAIRNCLLYTFYCSKAGAQVEGLGGLEPSPRNFSKVLAKGKIIGKGGN